MVATSYQSNKYTLDFFPEEKQELIKRHLEYVLKANETVNLTSISSYEDGLLLHIEDSLVAYPEIIEAPKGGYADLGTGGGFPGIPLSIVTGRFTTLVDSVKKKTTVLSTIIALLGLNNQIEVCSDRIEELSLKKTEQYSVLTARALSSLPSLLELSSPLLCPEGQLVCYKAQVDSNELRTALSLEDTLGMELLSDRRVVLSDGETKRRILVFKKIHKPKVSLPRRVGMAQKKPFSG